MPPSVPRVQECLLRLPVAFLTKIRVEETVLMARHWPLHEFLHSSRSTYCRILLLLAPSRAFATLSRADSTSHNWIFSRKKTRDGRPGGKNKIIICTKIHQAGDSRGCHSPDLEDSLNYPFDCTSICFRTKSSL